MPAAPCSHASSASSAVSTPLTSSGMPASPAMRSRSCQVSDGEIMSNTCCGVIAAAPERRDGDVGRDRERRARVALAIAAHRCVDRQHERAVAAVARLRDQLPRDALVAEDVQLEPARPADCGHFGRRRRRERREAHDRPRVACRARRRHLSVGMRDALERDRRDEQRHRDLLPEHGRRRAARLDVDEHPRAEHPAAIRLDVVAQRQLVAGAAGVVAVRSGLQPLRGEPLVVPDVERLHRRSVLRWPSPPPLTLHQERIDDDPDAARARADALRGADRAGAAGRRGSASCSRASCRRTCRRGDAAGARDRRASRARGTRSARRSCSARRGRGSGRRWSRWPVYARGARRAVRLRLRERGDRASGSRSASRRGRTSRYAASGPAASTSRSRRSACWRRPRPAAAATPSSLVLPLVGAAPQLFARAAPASRSTTRSSSGSAYRGTAFLLGDVIEADDAYTGAHSQHVVDARARGRATSSALDADTRRDAEFAALLHDVGKIRDPERDHQQARPARRRGVGDHRDAHDRGRGDARSASAACSAEVGAIVRVVRTSTGTATATRTASPARRSRSWRGSSRCCDAFNAMTTDRSYRKALTLERRRSPSCGAYAGTQFDPDVVAALARSSSACGRTSRRARDAAAAAARRARARPRRDRPASGRRARLRSAALDVALAEPQRLCVQRLLEERAREACVAERLVALGAREDRAQRVLGALAERVLGLGGEAREDLDEILRRVVGEVDLAREARTETRDSTRGSAASAAGSRRRSRRAGGGCPPCA